MITIGLSKQPVLDADPKAIQQINFTGNLDRVENTTTFFIIVEEKETILHFPQQTVTVIYFTFIQYQYKMTQYKTLNIKLSQSKLRSKKWS